jgi:chorismate mutase
MYKNMKRIKNLKELGGRIAKIDLELMKILKRRAELTRLVALYKIKTKQKPIIRLNIENQRIKAVKDWAKKNNIDPNFAAQILYCVINESCKQQLSELQKVIWLKK